MKKQFPFILFVLGLCVTYGSVVFSAPAFGPGEYLDPPCGPGTTYLSDDCTVSLGWQVNPTDGFVFNNTEDLIGIGTDTPATRLDVRGDFYNLYTAPDNGDIGSDPQGVGLVMNGDLGIFGDFGTIQLAGDSITPSIYAYQTTDFNEGDPRIAMHVTSEISALSFNLTTGTSELTLEAADVIAASGAYIELHTDGAVDFNSNPCPEDGIICPTGISSSFINMEVDGDLELYSVADMDVGDIFDPNDNQFTEYSSLTLENSAGIPQLNAVVNTVSGLLSLGSYLTLDPNDFTSLGVDDQSDQGSYSITMRPSYANGIAFSHTDTSLNLIDVGTIYLGGIDAGYGSITDRVLTEAVPSVDETPDFIMNQLLLYDDGIAFTYQLGQGTLSQAAEGSLTINDDFDFAANSNSGIIARFQGNGAACTLDPGAFAWACSSDRKLKKDIETLDSALDDILALRPVTYRLKNEDESVSETTGLIAQEVEDVLPKLVNHQSDGMLTLNYGGLTPFLVKAIQELDIKIESVQLEASQTFLSGISDWLADQANGIQNIFSNRIETNEFCVGSVCVNESEFGEIVDQIREDEDDSDTTGGSTTGTGGSTDDTGSTTGSDTGATGSGDTTAGGDGTTGSSDSSGGESTTGDEGSTSGGDTTGTGGSTDGSESTSTTGGDTDTSGSGDGDTTGGDDMGGLPE